MNRPGLVLVALAAVAVLAAPMAAQQQPTFKTATRTVPVYATVTDLAGRLVPDLERKDFAIYDNGKLQELTVFDNEAVPFSAALALDTSASITASIPRIQDAAVQFIIRMLPVDAAVVGYFNSKVQFSPGLTSDRDALVRHVRNEMQVGNETRLWDAFNASMDILMSATGRRVVVALTDGADFGSKLGSGDVITRAQHDDVMIYAIGIESYYHNGERWTLTRPGGSFRKAAEETGGGFFELKKGDDLNTTFSRVVNELHSQYVLGFTPQTLDGKEHKVEVRVTGAGLRARARKSYIAK